MCDRKKLLELSGNSREFHVHNCPDRMHQFAGQSTLGLCWNHYCEPKADPTILRRADTTVDSVVRTKHLRWLATLYPLVNLTSYSRASFEAGIFSQKLTYSCLRKRGTSLTTAPYSQYGIKLSLYLVKYCHIIRDIADICCFTKGTRINNLDTAVYPSALLDL